MTDQDGWLPPFAIDITSRDGVMALSFSGELDVSMSQDMRRAFLRPDVADAASVRVDLTQATFLDSSALGLLVTACRRTQDAGNSFSVLCGNGIARRVLAISGLTDYLHVVP